MASIKGFVGVIMTWQSGSVIGFRMAYYIKSPQNEYNTDLTHTVDCRRLLSIKACGCKATMTT